MPCWSCEGSDGDGLFCDRCGAVLPPRGAISHFARLGLPIAYDIDPSRLESSHKQLSKRLHPDRFVRADARARCFALEQTTALNDAYRTLRDPLRRAEYLLALQRAGEHIHPLGAGAGLPKVDQAFLVEMLETQERLLEAKHAGRAPEVQRIMDDIRRRRAEELAAVETAFRGGALGRVGERLAHIRFFDRVLSTAESRDELS